ncbi:hypothetical protein TRVA0_052S01068 [Trichomonascus vanleenenianus]|uniref:uncharacterized protein n=1 Tax=Trichomonascus vanleenenianus TaxID=2268995 RepID=UPI003ECA9724
MARRRRRQPTESENDQYRTLGGQRVGTVRRARDLAKALQAKPELEKQAREKKKSKLKAIVEAGERSQFNKKFDDAAFLEQSEELVKSVRESASVQAAAESSSASSSSPASSASSSKKPKGMDFFDEDYSSDDDDDE